MLIFKFCSLYFSNQVFIPQKVGSKKWPMKFFFFYFILIFFYPEKRRLMNKRPRSSEKSPRFRNQKQYI